MSHEVEPPHFGEQEPVAPGAHVPFGTGPGQAPEGGGPQPFASDDLYDSPPAYQPPSYPPQGYQQQGYPQSGYPQQGYPQQGYPSAWGAPPAPSASGGSGKQWFAIIGGGVAALVVVGIVIAAIVLNGHGKSSPAAAAASPSAAAPGTTAPNAAASGTAAASAAPATCTAAPSLSAEPVGYQACGTAARNVGVPTYDSAQAHQSYTVTILTNRGNIVFTANGAAAPYTVFSFVYLAQKQYFANTECHRLTTSGIYVLQCGDPTGTGSGGPGYEFQDENLNAFGPAGADGTVTYPAGTVAMANAGYGTNGSQFFLVYQDSPLAPSYTPFGTITQGLSILTSIAAQGTNNANGAGDGAPDEPVEIHQVTAS
jgi:peptidyl-prolyl cis-trans isomerase B (cyclophilin B)